MDFTRVNNQGKKYLFHHVTKNTSYQIIGKLFTALTTLFVIRLVTKNYGSTGAGELTLILNYLNIFYLLADFGVNAIIVKLMIENPNEELRIFKSLLGLRIAASTVLAVLAIIIGIIFGQLLFHQNQLQQTTNFSKDIILLAITIVLQAIYLSTTTIFQKKLLYNRSQTALAIGSIVTFVCFALLARHDVPLIVPLAAYLFGSLTTAGLALYFLPFSLTEKIIPHFNFDDWKNIIKPSLPIAATLVLNVVYFKSDSFILAGLKPLTDVGIYGVAYKVFEQAIVIPIFFVNALYPVLLNQITYQPERLKKTLILSSVVLLAGGLVLATVEIILAPLLIAIVTSGRGFTDAILPLRILAAGLPFFFLSNLYLWLLVTLGQQKHLIVIYGVSMIFNVAANFFLIPQYSYVASAALTAISEAIVLALTMSYGLYFLNKKLKEQLI